jgi:orotate phosphoribosyltransferase
MTPDDVRRAFEETGALLTGHFKLSSGLHSDRYLQCALVLQWPERAAALGAALGRALARFRPDVVVSPAMGGLIIGHEVGRALSCRAIFAERVEGTFTFRRGLGLSEGEKVVVVEDVVTTAKSTREVVDLVRACRAEVVACAAIVDRRKGADVLPGTPVFGLPFRAVLSMDVATWDAAACPHCMEGMTIIAPGSRFLVPPGKES